MPILRTLDADRDLTLPPQEIADAPAVLRRLAANYDGKLTPDECGLHANASAQLRGRFMNYHPVLASLDANHDGEISVWEIARASASLKKLDRNRDGCLTADELIPFEMAVHACLR
jgi:hypothetical protein